MTISDRIKFATISAALILIYILSVEIYAYKLGIYWTLSAPITTFFSCLLVWRPKNQPGIKHTLLISAALTLLFHVFNYILFGLVAITGHFLINGFDSFSDSTKAIFYMAGYFALGAGIQVIFFIFLFSAFVVVSSQRPVTRSS